MRKSSWVSPRLVGNFSNGPRLDEINVPGWKDFSQCVYVCPPRKNTQTNQQQETKTKTKKIKKKETFEWFKVLWCMCAV